MTMKLNATTMKVWMLAAMMTASTTAMAGDGTKNAPYTVAELNAQKDALAASGNTVWVKADLKGLGEDGTLTENSDTEVGGKTVKQMAALFGDATGEFVAYSWQILGQIALSDLTNTKDLLIALTYGTAGHPYGNTANPQYASNEEPQTEHFSLEEVHGALTLNIENGYRGYHIPACYIIPKEVVAVKVSAGYSNNNGAYVNCGNNFIGADETIITPKNAALVLIAKNGSHDFVLTAGLNEQKISNGNAMNGGTTAGVNTITTKDRWHYRFVATATKVGFERNCDNATDVELASKDEIFLSVSSKDNNFGGKYNFETPDKKWISWNGSSIVDFPSGIVTVDSSDTMANKYFDMQGRRVNTPSKGIYINNGKKVIK